MKKFTKEATLANMKKAKRYFSMALISAMVAFSSSTIFAPTLTEAQAGINATVTKEDLGDKEIKLVVFSRTKQLDAPPISMPAGDVQCQQGEVVTGGGFKLNDPTSSTIISSNKVSNGWAVTFVNNGDRPTFATIFAECAHIEISP